MTQLQINEVAPRDGFQIEATFVPTADKIRLIDALSATGLARIEATSFVSPKAIPHLRDAAEVVSGIQRRDGVGITVLVPNVKGLERALECRVDEVNLVMSASDSHGQANLRMTPSSPSNSLSPSSRCCVATLAGATSSSTPRSRPVSAVPSRARYPRRACSSWWSGSWRWAYRG